ncbi:MAG: threonine--tRNA ligase [Candidatus Aureabacteria bacterium]|nr:threonine--tRNA ligase [Candidatus Auribacterota bacterium]
MSKTPLKSTGADLEALRHSASHVMAEAVLKLFPGTKLAIGPAIEDGFYYDFETPGAFTPDVLEEIEKLMAESIKANHRFERIEMDREEALKFFRQKDQIYKMELIESIPDEKILFYKHGDFIDLCKGPHVVSTGEVKAFKLLKIAGAYWRGDEKNKMLQRIYGIAFYNKKQLEDHLNKLEEAKKRDHRKLGKDLNLFSMQESIGPGLVLWHPKGALIRKIIEDFWKDEHLKAGYDLVNTPHIALLDLWKRSGHLDFYEENMYSPMQVDEFKYEIKPMNCPFHIAIYKNQIHSYREFPIRWAELGTVYRYERRGVLHGLIRVRGFTQDDAHIFCLPGQLEEEIKKIIDFVVYMLSTFGFKEYDVYLSTRPEKFVGSQENWQKATNALKNALEQKKMKYEVDLGEGVFYGPKIDIKIKDVMGRAHQCSTIQVDFNIPEKFDVSYIGEDGNEHRPIMIHRALMGSLERFFAVLIEHYGGAFPVWLSPVQTELITISDAQLEYASSVKKKLEEKGIRVHLDDRNEKMGAKIREAQMQKIPYMIIIGNKEMEDQTVSVRTRKGDQQNGIKIENFISEINRKIDAKN